MKDDKSALEAEKQRQKNVEYHKGGEAGQKADRPADYQEALSAAGNNFSKPTPAKPSEDYGATEKRLEPPEGKGEERDREDKIEGEDRKGRPNYADNVKRGWSEGS